MQHNNDMKHTSNFTFANKKKKNVKMKLSNQVLDLNLT